MNVTELEIENEREADDRMTSHQWHQKGGIYEGMKVMLGMLMI